MYAKHNVEPCECVCVCATEWCCCDSVCLSMYVWVVRQMNALGSGARITVYWTAEPTAGARRKDKAQRTKDNGDESGAQLERSSKTKAGHPGVWNASIASQLQAFPHFPEILWLLANTWKQNKRIFKYY